jgi:hypothetical protein
MGAAVTAVLRAAFPSGWAAGIGNGRGKPRPYGTVCAGVTS